MKRQEGFKGQESIVLPESIIREMAINPLAMLLYVTDIGYYPNAKDHFRIREDGCEQNILIYCVEGEGWYETEIGKFQVKRNQYFIIPENMPHCYGSSKFNPWTIYWLHFAGEKASLFVGKQNGPMEITEAVNARYQDRILLFEEIFQNLNKGFSAENLEYANICLWHMLGSFRYLSQFRTVNELKQQDSLDKSIAMMKANLETSLALSDLAEKAGLSESHFSLMFKKKTGMTPITYFSHLKIQKACQMLDFSNFHIKEIAQHVGFDDPYYFSRVFSRIMGMSPMKYRKNKKG